jgi:hypothetical protein
LSRTQHLTRKEFADNSRPTRARARTRLTKLGDRSYFPTTDRPVNAGNQWCGGYNAGQRRREEARRTKVIGRRLERRRLNRSVGA